MFDLLSWGHGEKQLWRDQRSNSDLDRWDQGQQFPGNSLRQTTNRPTEVEGRFTGADKGLVTKLRGGAGPVTGFRKGGGGGPCNC